MPKKLGLSLKEKRTEELVTAIRVGRARAPEDDGLPSIREDSEPV